MFLLGRPGVCGRAGSAAKKFVLNLLPARASGNVRPPGLGCGNVSREQKLKIRERERERDPAGTKGDNEDEAGRKVIEKDGNR